MKILQVIPSLATRTGGPAVSVTEASRELKRLGHEVSIMTTDLARPARAKYRGGVSDTELPAFVGQLDARIFRSRPPRRFALSPELGRALRDTVSAYDVVHIHSLFLYPQYAAYREALRTGVPYVVSPRGALAPLLRKRGRLRKKLMNSMWQKKMLERAAAIHVTSEQEAEFIVGIAGGTKRFIIPNGVHWDMFAPQPPPGEFRHQHLDGFSGPLVLAHGRLTRKKGLDVLIRALALISQEVPDCRLALVGPDDEDFTPKLESVARDVGVAERVHFCGPLVGSDLRAALSATDVWALPSHTESFTVAAVEALAAGRAIVVSPDVGVARDAQRSGAAIVAVRRPQAFAKEIARLLGNADVRIELGERGRNYARRYDWTIVVPQLEEMYLKVMA